VRHLLLEQAWARRDSPPAELDLYQTEASRCCSALEVKQNPEGHS
jgi:hypothetical protein